MRAEQILEWTAQIDADLRQSQEQLSGTLDQFFVDEDDIFENTYDSANFIPVESIQKLKDSVNIVSVIESFALVGFHERAIIVHRQCVRFMITINHP